VFEEQIAKDRFEDTLSTSAAAKLLHVSSETLRRWTDQGRLPAVRTDGGHRRWRKAAVIAFACRQQQQINGDDMTVVDVVVRPAAWEGELRVWTDGNVIAHEIEYKKRAVSPGTYSEAAIRKGLTWKPDRELQTYFDEDSGNYLAQFYFTSVGSDRAAVEADVADALAQSVKELEELTPVRGVVGYRTAEGKILSGPEAY
jgi:excisionase family DNA binding protein